MENRNEPMSAETPKQWGDAHGWNLGEVTLDMMQKYAQYCLSFQPESVEDAINWQYPIEQERASKALWTDEDLNKAARFGASLTSSIDWDKLKEGWELHYEVTNWQTCGGKLYTTAELYQIFLNQKYKK